ncbi:electroneutral sodium bicarbonate exchanger 1 [Bacillus rossius redtenbacheri]|uniref:electroneutral sodium bicarbonate exchanger 1 n=1 Tax=Bacillus rossius redtenbacheri TaxID=93214 RepID=UPI002FDDAFD8
MDTSQDMAASPQDLRQFPEDTEGRRSHTVYVGVHLPGPPRRRHKCQQGQGGDSGSDDDGDDEEEPPRKLIVGRRGRLASITDDVTPPAQRVQFILGEDAEGGAHTSHPLFSEMEELVQKGDDMEWKETARWVKFEEDVEEGGNRWSKPHVATLSLHSLLELRSLLLNGAVMLDLEAASLEQVADLVLEHMVTASMVASELRDKVKEALLRRHRHQHERRKENSSHNMSRLPIIRSLAEIGRNYSSSKMDESPPSAPLQASTPVTHKSASDFGRFLSVPGPGSSVAQQPPDHGNIQHSHSSSSITHNQSASHLGDVSGDASPPKGNMHFMRKLPAGAEASNILVGEVDFLDKTLSAFIRLSQANFLGDLTEVPVPTRFLFILLGPRGGIGRYHEIGRAMATLMSDEVFHDVAYKARNRNHLLAAMDEFLDVVTVLPPGEWDPAIRIEPPADIPSQDQRKRPPEKEEQAEEEDEQKIREESGLVRSGRLFGGLVNDIKRKVPWYWSDFKDALALQCVASWIFLYFACLSPIITFGGLLGQATGNNIAAMESLLSGFVSGLGYGFFSGQPLTILGSTGPVLVFESIMYEFCQQRDWEYLSFRLWIGVWIGIILLILVAVDASAFVCYITRFTEENFATLIALIFIYKAVENVLHIGRDYPVDTGSAVECYCVPGGDESPRNISWFTLSDEECQQHNGTMFGRGCSGKYYIPDVFLMSIILFFGTFLISVQLKDFKNALFFPSKVRQIVSDFAVIIAILSMSGLDSCVGINTPKLRVPAEFKPTLSTRGWVIEPFGRNPYWTAVVAVAPALLGTILIFMDQQITAVIINRKEHKLKKGCGYHLDLFVLANLIIVCSIMGLPWFVAATVLSINHVNSLKVESECAAPGEKPHFLGVREQRATHILIFVMMGLSVFITPLLGHIPMPVLYGVFLYMGASSLKGLQFFDRILLFFMPVKYQPDYMYLRKVPLKRVHIFTLIQLACLIVLWVIKSFSSTSILFPLMLVVMIGIRKSLDFIFTQRELKILDDVMPETIRRSNEDEMKKLHSEEDGKATDFGPGANLQIPLANGNVVKIPYTSINITEEVNKTGLWKHVNENTMGNKEDKKKSKNGLRSKRRGSKKDAVLEDEMKRLSTMAEEEEAAGATAKSQRIVWAGESKRGNGVSGAETEL